MYDKRITKNAARTRQAARKAGINMSSYPILDSKISQEEFEQPDIM